jgi:hypothetical protein
VPFSTSAIDRIRLEARTTLAAEASSLAPAFGLNVGFSGRQQAGREPVTSPH